MRTRWLTLNALRHGLGQAVVLSLLSALAIASCAYGPLYERAVEQAALRSAVAQAPASGRAVTVHAASPAAASALLPTGPVRHSFGPQLSGAELAITALAGSRALSAELVSRGDLCAHVSIVAGRCPSADGEVIASSSSAGLVHLGLGESLPAKGVNGDYAYPIGGVRVVGLYRPFTSSDPYWLDRTYSSVAGGYVARVDGTVIYFVDALFGTPGFLAGIADIYARTLQPSQSPPKTPPVDFTAAIGLLPQRTSVDDVPALRGALAGVEQRIREGPTSDGSPAGSVSTGLPDILDAADAGRRQARQVIPAFAMQLALVVLVLLGVVLVAGAEQRQPAFALARLRGHSRRGAAGMFVREIASLVALSAVPGIAAAWAACAVVASWRLPDGVGPEPWRAPVLLAAGAVLLLELLLVAVVARRAAGQPVHDMLRSVAQRASGRGVGLGEAAFAVAAASGLVILLAGDRRDPVAVLTPALMALVAGQVVSRVALVVARRAGTRALWRGRIAVALAALQVARRPGFRRVTVLVCLASALVVSSVDQWSVAGRNRKIRAGVEVGTPVVLTVGAGSARTLRDAVRAADPTGRFALPVAVQQPTGTAPLVLAADPVALRRLAAWGRPEDRPSARILAALAPTPPPPVTIRGGALRITLANLSVWRTPGGDAIGTSRPGPLRLQVLLVRPDNSTTTVEMTLPEKRPSVTLSAAAAGCAGGCSIRQLSLLRAVGDGDAVHVNADVVSVTGDAPGSLPASLGSAAQWADPTVLGAGQAEPRDQYLHLQTVGDTATITALSTGDDVSLRHADVPLTPPCAWAGPPLDPSDQDLITSNGLDGRQLIYQRVTTVPLLPRVRTGALLVDLDTAIAASSPRLDGSTLMVWLGRDDPQRERALVSRLTAAGITVIDRQTVAARTSALARSAPAWAIEFGLVIAVLCAILAALLVAIVATTSRRQRGEDLAALRTLGLGRREVWRATVVEQLIAVVLGGVVGAAVGLLGAHLALPAVPIFVVDESPPATVLRSAWPASLAAAAGALVLLSAAAVLVAVAVLRPPDRRAGAS